MGSIRSYRIHNLQVQILGERTDPGGAQTDVLHGPGYVSVAAEVPYPDRRLRKDGQGAHVSRHTVAGAPLNTASYQLKLTDANGPL